MADKIKPILDGANVPNRKPVVKFKPRIKVALKSTASVPTPATPSPEPSNGPDTYPGIAQHILRPNDDLNS